MSPDDLSFTECCQVIDEIAEYAPFILVLSGGEPLWRRDVFDIAHRAKSKGLRVALATNGTLVDETMAHRIHDAGIERVSISLDGADRVTHDTFRGHRGAFDSAVRGIRCLKELGVSTQINTTVSRHNEHQLADILKLAKDLGVDAFHMFLLVPVGCGLTIQDEQAVNGADAERILNWLYDRSLDSNMDLKATCAPHYYRILRQRRTEARRAGETVPELAKEGMHAVTKGCLAGTAVCFISHQGDVYPCGYLPVTAGNLRRDRFRHVWENAPVFQSLRDPENLSGKCSICEYKNVCMGCRARAHGMTGDYLAEEPFCIHQPKQTHGDHNNPIQA
jgi:heme b synthase